MVLHSLSKFIYPTIRLESLNFNNQLKEERNGLLFGLDLSKVISDCQSSDTL